MRIKWPRIFSFATISVVIFVATLLGTRFLLSEMVSKEDLQRRTLMQSEIKDSQRADIKKTGTQDTLAQKHRLRSIIERGELRVGYNPENLPFSFIDDKGDLVGFDVELMHVLARELRVELEFIPWTYKTIIKKLERNEFDVAIGGLIVTPERLTRVNFSNPYMNITKAVVAEDHIRQQFTSWRTIDKELKIRLGVVGKTMTMDVKRYLPNTDIKKLDSYSEFFTDNPKNVGAIVISAEAGSAWTILYPAYDVVVPEPHIKANAALAMPLGDSDLEGFINNWLQMKKTSGIINKLYDKWILGKSEEQKKPRWSIGRDVFGLWE